MFAKRLFFLTLFFPWIVSSTEPSPHSPPPPTAWVTIGEDSPFPIKGLRWDGKQFKGADSKDTPLAFTSKQVAHLWFSPPNREVMAHRESISLKLREPVRIPYKMLPEALEIRFRLPPEPGLYLLPLVDEHGAPLRNTFQLWIGDETVYAKGRGFGRNDMTAMEPWTRRIPDVENGEVLVQILIDRKEEICLLKLNHTLIQSWKIPTSYLEKQEGQFFLELRSGIDPQEIQDLHVFTWPTGHIKDAKEPGREGNRIWLRNGDHLPGEPLRIEDDKVWVRLEGGTILPIPFSRIREITFAH